MIRIYVTRFTHTGTLGNYIVSNPMTDRFNELSNVGNVELSCYYADQDPVTRLPKTDVVVCVLRGGSVIDGINLAGVQQLPVGRKDEPLTNLSQQARQKVRSIVQTIDPDVDTSQFTTIEDVILYIIRSVRPAFQRFGNGYDEGQFD